MSKRPVSELKQCVHRGEKTGKSTGCSNLPIYKCAVHKQCVMWKTCKTGAVKICKECPDFEKKDV